MEAFDVTISLKGHERNHFNHNNNPNHRKSNERVIINSTYPVVYFPSYKSLPGMWTYPFELNVPNWLPVSTSLTEMHDHTHMGIHYELIA